MHNIRRLDDRDLIIRGDYGLNSAVTVVSCWTSMVPPYTLTWRTGRDEQSYEWFVRLVVEGIKQR